MELREFTIDVPGKGKVDVHFALHFSDHDNSVSAQEIKIHSDFDSGLPKHPHLMLVDNEWQFHTQHAVLKDSDVIVEDEFSTEGLSKEIITRIREYMDDAKVR